MGAKQILCGTYGFCDLLGQIQLVPRGDGEIFRGRILDAAANFVTFHMKRLQKLQGAHVSAPLVGPRPERTPPPPAGGLSYAHRSLKGSPNPTKTSRRWLINSQKHGREGLQAASWSCSYSSNLTTSLKSLRKSSSAPGSVDLPLAWPAWPDHQPLLLDHSASLDHQSFHS